jgi:hypothetical protein
MQIRKLLTVVEETRQEAGRAIAPPILKAAAVAVIKNDFAGGFHEDLSALTDIGEELGELLGQRAVAALSDAPGGIHSYGKGAIVGEDGELEHAAAILHPKFGNPIRNACGGGKAIIPSAKKRGGMGTPLDVPLHYKDAAFVRTHYDAMEVRLCDAPRRDEILIAVVVTKGGRPLPRIGGLKISEVQGTDGLR